MNEQAITIGYIVDVCGHNAERIEQLAQRLGVGTGSGWYPDARAIVQLAQRLPYEVPREVFSEMAAQYRSQL